MATNKLISVADELVSILNASVALGRFLAVREHAPRFNLKAGELDSLRVTVVPMGRSYEPASRGSYERDYVCSVLVQKKIERTEEEMVAAHDIVQEIMDYWLTNPRLPSTRVRVMLWENNPVYAAEHFHEDGVFTSVIDLTLREWR